MIAATGCRRGIGLLLLVSGGVAGCDRAPSVGVGLAIEPGWHRAAAVSIETLGDVPITWVSDSTRRVNDAAPAMQYAEWLAENKVAVVIGHSGSRGSVAAAPVYVRAGIVQIAPLATSSQLPTPPAYGLVPDDSVEGSFLAAFVDTALQARRVAILYHNDEYGVGIRDGVVTGLAARGITVADERYLSPLVMGFPQLRVEPLLAAALRTRPDVFILAARETEARAAMAYLKRKAPAIPIVCSDGCLVLAPNAAGRDLAALEGMRIVRFWAEESGAAAAFIDRFRTRFGYPPDQADVMTFDAVMLVGAAVRSGARDAAAVREYLDGLGRARPAFRGLATNYQFDAGRPSASMLSMGVVRGGRLQAPSRPGPR